MLKPGESNLQWAESLWPKIHAKMDAQCSRIGTEIPYTLVEGKRNDKMANDLFWWTNGFWPGMLWLMYSDTKDEKYRKTAEKINERFDAALEG